MIKLIMMSILGTILILFSFTAYADKIVISGKPALLDYHPGFFTLPSSYMETNGYRYVTLSNDDRVCFLRPKKELSSLDMFSIIIEEKGDKFKWFCYKFDPNFFETDY